MPSICRTESFEDFPQEVKILNQSYMYLTAVIILVILFWASNTYMYNECIAESRESPLPDKGSLYSLIPFCEPSCYALRYNKRFIVPERKADHFRNRFMIRSCIDYIYT